MLLSMLIPVILFAITPIHAFTSIANVQTRVGRASLHKSSMSITGPEVERALLKRFPPEQISRVVGSWNRLLQGDDFSQVWEGKGLQQASSYMEGLLSEPWHDLDSGLFPWARGLEQQAGVIAEELRTALAMKDLEKRGNNVWVPPVVQDAVAYGPEWRTLVIQDRQWDPVNTKIFPKTTSILKNLGVPSCEAFFARQGPKTGIKPHTDDTNFVLTCHLGLDVPEGECWIRVGEEKREWRNNKLLIFDTSYIHETSNESEKPRTVLLIRFFHPQVTDVERKALQFIFDVLEDPSLAEDEPERPPMQAQPAGMDGMSRQERRKSEREARKKERQ